MPPAAAFIASSAGMRRNATIQRGKAAQAAAAAAAADAADADDADAGAGAAVEPARNAVFSSTTEDEVLARGVERSLLLAVLKARRRRAAQCRSLPPALLFYALFILAMCSHVRVPTSFDIERG
jgi:hypothetical protein